MFLNRSVKLRLAASLGLCVALLVGVGALGIYSSRQGQEDLRDTYTNNLIPIQMLGVVNNGILMNRIQLNAALINEDPALIPAIRAKVDAQVQKVDGDWAKYKKASVPDAREQGARNSYEQHVATLRNNFNHALDLAAAGQFAEAERVLSDEVRADYGLVLADLEQVIDSNVDAAAENFETGQSDYAFMSTLLMGTMALAIGLAIALAFWLIRGIMMPLSKAREFAESLAEGRLDADIDVTCKDEFGDMLGALQGMKLKLAEVVNAVRLNADSVSMSSAEISQGNNDLNRRTQEQAASLEETAASMEEITTTVRQNADNATRADELVNGVSQKAENGGRVAQEAVGAMSEISASSQQIAGIVGMIDTIAFQTNLLALNAAVEAARAGEQGRGFAVVASEVRTLASRSADAAREIKQLVEQSVVRVEAGSALVVTAGQSLDEISSGVSQVRTLVSEIATASKEQAQGIDQINTAISQMDGVTQQNASLVEQSTAASQSLEDQARELLQQMAFFKVDNTRPMTPKRPAVKADAPSRSHQPAAPSRPVAKKPTATRALAPASSAPVAKTPAQPARRSVATVDNDDDWTEF
ncbi:methyl-accepting chemotaxis protein [Larsenimonas rhizosphaerae]|uniref:Methyl-accepting chemotaxis protein n=1 Tax=Larsenimonas rhizosphaerae TaxID=2944682 RepID=A0AA41ZFE6_9GAMM|nr:methyl-accepting chemotaxis protein [Larsenimonas rhizosphaerae]MCX2524244.1 methyl-accepting chemotaxis protein [Larsenimonas rhizosphaerae]